MNYEREERERRDREYEEQQEQRRYKEYESYSKDNQEDKEQVDENKSTKNKKLTRSKTDKKLLGVCGGIAKYFDTDSVVIRLIWIILTLFGGSGVLLYIIAAILMPEDDTI